MYITGWRVIRRPGFYLFNMPTLELRATMECPSCHIKTEGVLEKDSDIWRYGVDALANERRSERSLEGRLREIIMTEMDFRLTPAAEVYRLYSCSHCGSASVVANKDFARVLGEVRTAVGHLHEGHAADWAWDILTEFMVRHQQAAITGDNECSYDWHDGGINRFLLLLCPCERCEAGREGDMWIKALAPVHFDLADFPVPAEPARGILLP
jgi:hypothetical protein